MGDPNSDEGTYIHCGTLHIYTYTLCCKANSRRLSGGNISLGTSLPAGLASNFAVWRLVASKNKNIFLAWFHGQRTLKTPIPRCCLYWSFLFGVVMQFCRFWIWSERECKTPAEYGLQHNATTTPPPTATHCLYILYICLGRGGEVRENSEKVEG